METATHIRSKLMAGMGGRQLIGNSMHTVVGTDSDVPRNRSFETPAAVLAELSHLSSSRYRLHHHLANCARALATQSR